VRRLSCEPVGARPDPIADKRIVGGRAGDEHPQGASLFGRNGVPGGRRVVEENCAAYLGRLDAQTGGRSSSRGTDRCCIPPTPIAFPHFLKPDGPVETCGESRRVRGAQAPVREGRPLVEEGKERAFPIRRRRADRTHATALQGRARSADGRWEGRPGRWEGRPGRERGAREGEGSTP
jgi:hypothetical protein